MRGVKEKNKNERMSNLSIATYTVYHESQNNVSPFSLKRLTFLSNTPYFFEKQGLLDTDSLDYEQA